MCTFFIYCYCYRRDWLDQHMRNAEKGIRFIDSNYNDMFMLPDGGRIQVTNPDGERREYVCRFIDPYHVEVGSGACRVFLGSGLSGTVEREQGHHLLPHSKRRF